MAEPEYDDPDDPNITVTLAGREITIRDRYETASIVNDALIALEFLVGSFFFFEGLPSSAKDVGVWLFVVGSAQLAVRPAIRLSRRFTLRRLAGRRYHESADDF
jgi:hypothetical protein